MMPTLTLLKLQLALVETESRLSRACDQIYLLDARLDDIQHRRDIVNSRPTFRYNLLLRQRVTEGIRNTYYEYAWKKAEEIALLKYQIGKVEQTLSS